MVFLTQLKLSPVIDVVAQPSLVTQSVDPQPSSVLPQDVPMHRSSRASRPPSYLRDYHCNLLHTTTTLPPSAKFPLADFLSYDKLSPAFRQYILTTRRDQRINSENFLQLEKGRDLL